MSNKTFADVLKETIERFRKRIEEDKKTKVASDAPAEPEENSENAE